MRSRIFCQHMLPRTYRSGYSFTLRVRWHQTMAVFYSLCKRPSPLTSNLRSAALDIGLIDDVVTGLWKHELDLPDKGRQGFTKQENESTVS